MHVGPQFVVKDVNASIDFYKDVLGFKVEYINGSPFAYAVVFCDKKGGTGIEFLSFFSDKSNKDLILK